ncbi:uncharacterized protein LOC143242618 isoform X3 [Tachypleus tridentatus]|uniref:uncharacterized protein LOC143242618 isoform X3 n=1 Tax=Tachypleus tridentatus TaxID=6853 RepID=UPI003FD1BED8
MFPCTPPAESARSNIAYLGMISQCLLIQNLLEGLKKVHSRCALLILGRTSQMNISCCFLSKLETLKIYMLHSLEIRSFMAVTYLQC